MSLQIASPYVMAQGASWDGADTPGLKDQAEIDEAQEIRDEVKSEIERIVDIIEKATGSGDQTEPGEIVPDLGLPNITVTQEAFDEVGSNFPRHKARGTSANNWLKAIDIYDEQLDQNEEITDEQRWKIRRLLRQLREYYTHCRFAAADAICKDISVVLTGIALDIGSSAVGGTVGRCVTRFGGRVRGAMKEARDKICGWLGGTKPPAPRPPTAPWPKYRHGDPLPADFTQEKIDLVKKRAEKMARLGHPNASADELAEIAEQKFRIFMDYYISKPYIPPQVVPVVTVPNPPAPTIRLTRPPPEPPPLPSLDTLPLPPPSTMGTLGVKLPRPQPPATASTARLPNPRSVDTRPPPRPTGDTTIALPTRTGDTTLLPPDLGGAALPSVMLVPPAVGLAPVATQEDGVAFAQDESARFDQVVTGVKSPITGPADLAIRAPRIQSSPPVDLNADDQGSQATRSIPIRGLQFDASGQTLVRGLPPVAPNPTNNAEKNKSAALAVDGQN
jgi:hypothetical protein